jgi:hypothetical protein
MPAARSFSFSATHGVIDGIHRDPSNAGTTTFPTISACLAYSGILMFGIANHANGGTTTGFNYANFSARHF